MIVDYDPAERDDRVRHGVPLVIGLRVSRVQAMSCFPRSDRSTARIGRHMPPPAVRAYLKVIEAAPDVTARAVAA